MSQMSIYTVPMWLIPHPNLLVGPWRSIHEDVYGSRDPKRTSCILEIAEARLIRGLQRLGSNILLTDENMEEIRPALMVLDRLRKKRNYAEPRRVRQVLALSEIFMRKAYVLCRYDEKFCISRCIGSKNLSALFLTEFRSLKAGFIQDLTLRRAKVLAELNVASCDTAEIIKPQEHVYGSSIWSVEIRVDRVDEKEAVTFDHTLANLDLKKLYSLLFHPRVIFSCSYEVSLSRQKQIIAAFLQHLYLANELFVSFVIQIINDRTKNRSRVIEDFKGNRAEISKPWKNKFLQEWLPAWREEDIASGFEESFADEDSDDEIDES